VSYPPDDSEHCCPDDPDQAVHAVDDVRRVRVAADREQGETEGEDLELKKAVVSREVEVRDPAVQQHEADRCGPKAEQQPAVGRDLLGQILEETSRERRKCGEEIERHPAAVLVAEDQRARRYACEDSETADPRNWFGMDLLQAGDRVVDREPAMRALRR